MRALPTTAVFAVLLTAAGASAQVLTPPPRSSNGLFGGAVTRPSEASHELTADMMGLGSYEENLSGGGGGVSGPAIGGGFSDPRVRGTAGLFSANLHYGYGRAGRFIEAGSNGYVHSFRGLDVRPMYGGSLDVRAGSSLGRIVSISAGASAQYQPTFMLTSDPVVPIGPPGDAIAPSDPTNGVAELQSRNGAVNSMLEFAWNPRHRTSSSFGYQVVRMNGLETTTNSRGHGELVSHYWGVRRTVALQMNYQHSHQSVESLTEPERPTDSHIGRLNLEWHKRLSRTRALSLGVGSGAMQISTVSVFDDQPFDYVAPSFSGRVRVDLGRTWSVSADASRDVTVLEGVTRQSFLTDVGTLWVGGNIGQSWVVALNGSFSHGNPHEGEDGSMESTMAVAQLQYVFATCCTLVSTYSRYTHFLRGLVNLAPGFPSRVERHSVRVGMTLSLPLYGRSSGTQQFQTGRN
jgi:hypothetical protein